MYTHILNSIRDEKTLEILNEFHFYMRRLEANHGWWKDPGPVVKSAAKQSKLGVIPNQYTYALDSILILAAMREHPNKKLDEFIRLRKEYKRTLTLLANHPNDPYVCLTLNRIKRELIKLVLEINKYVEFVPVINFGGLMTYTTDIDLENFNQNDI